MFGGPERWPPRPIDLFSADVGGPLVRAAGAVAAHTVATIVEDRVAVGIEAGRDVVGQRRRSLHVQADANAVPQRRVEVEEDAVAHVLGGRTPVGVGIEAVRRQRRRIVRVVARAGVLIHHHANDAARDVTRVQRHGEPIRRPLAGRLDLGDVTDRRIRPHPVHRRVDVNRSQRVAAARPHVVAAEVRPGRERTLQANRRLLDDRLVER